MLAILIEVGTHTNSRTAAERGVEHFAEGIPRVIGAITGPEVAPGVKKGLERTGTGKSILWLFMLAIIGGGSFLFLSTGSLQGSWAKLSQLGKEFANYLGPKKIEAEFEKKSEAGNEERRGEDS